MPALQEYQDMVKTGWHRYSEIYEDIFWDPVNSERHFEKRPIDFVVTKVCNWNRILKRKDVEHPDHPPRSNALVESVLMGTIYFVTYTRVAGKLKIIQVRYANAEERARFHADA